MTDRELPRRPSHIKCAAGTCFRFDFRLATSANSLALASRSKTRHWLNRIDSTVTSSFFCGPTLSCRIVMSPPNFRVFSHSSRSAFQLSLTLLIHYRSYAPYLDLDVDTPIFMPPIQKTLLFLVSSAFLPLRDYHPLGYVFPDDFGSKNGCTPPHLPLHYCNGIQLDLSGFHSLLLTGSQLVSFPSPTKTLHFREFLHITVHSQILGLKPACGYPRLIAACHAAMRA